MKWKDIAMQWKVFYFSETRSSCVKQEHRLHAALEVQCTETQTPKSTTSSETQTSPLTFRYSEIASNDEAVKFYTGLPTCSVFEQVLAHLLSCSSPTLAVKSHTTTNVRLCDADRLLLTLMRLRLGLLVQDLNCLPLWHQ